MSDFVKIELPITIASAERLARQLCEEKIAPSEAARGLVIVLRGARLEADEVTFRQLGDRVRGIRSQASVNRALSLRHPKISRWEIVRAILDIGLDVGPDTLQAVRKAWIAARQAESRADGQATA